MTDLARTLSTIGISALGVGAPILAPRWTDGATPTVDDAAMALNLSSGSWLCPAAGTLRTIESAAIGVTLVRANGALASGPGLLLTLFPQVYLRLARLYAQVLEGGARPESARGLPFRPVPRYFFYAGTPGSGAVSGNIGPQAAIDLDGELTIYDNDGMPIDPLAVAAAFQAFMTRHNVLQHRDPPGAPFDANPQVAQIATGLAGASVVRVRLANHAGQPYGGAHLNGLTAVSSGSGIFTLNAAAGGGSDLTGSITKEAGTGASGSFPDDERRLLLLGPATTGRLGDEFRPPVLPAGVTLARDFFSIRVVELRPYLLGSPNPAFTGTQAEPRPAIRTDEPLDLLADGNDVLGAAGAALTGATEESLCVAQAIAGTFNVPTATGSGAHWPDFPPPAGVTPAAPGPLPVNLRNGFNPSAQYFDDGDPATANVDVVLTLNGLPAGAAVRAYNRMFVEDAREARGDGAGGVVDASGTLRLLLRDPLGLRRPGLPESAISIPSEATLHCDVMVVKRSGEARLYGNVEAPIIGTTTAAPPAGANPFATAARRGVSNAGILGLRAPGLPSVSGLPLREALLRVLQALTGETNPRDASRLPTMARRDLLVAGRASGTWRAVIASGRLTPETHSADPRRGAPGSPGGRETQVVGVAIRTGRLAYDIARMAFRRTTNLVTRMNDLAGATWDEPPVATSGSFAGAVLQTIAPGCETPELALLQPAIEANLSSIPATFDDLVDWLVDRVNTIAADPSISGNPFLSGIVSTIQTQIVAALNNLKDNNALSESTRERLYNELRREVMAACYGRRDAQWALAGAIANARRFIYIESPGVASTQKDYGTGAVPPYAANLFERIAARQAQASGLHVIICSPKHPDFAAGYEAFAAHEAADRRARILALPAERTVTFHPVGFPGRPSRLESLVVIVDDVWALVGSSSFRRRGLTFDGGSDLVFTDAALVEGRSPAIADFRRRLMASRLGVPGGAQSPFGLMPHPTFVRLADGIEAFYAIREQLVAGGLGTIERLWNGRTPGVTPIDPNSVSIDLANPEGQEYDLIGTLALSAIASLNAF